MRKLTILITCLLLAGCAASASGPRFVKPGAISADKSVLYIYRKYQWHGNPGIDKFVIDGKQTITLRNAGYRKITLTPGRHWIDIKEAGDQTTDNYITMRGGEAVFLRIDPIATGKDATPVAVPTGTPIVLLVPIPYSIYSLGLVRVEPKQALRELSQLRLSN